MTLANNGDDSAESYSAAVREAGGVWNGRGNGAVESCVLDDGVQSIKQQLEQVKAAQQMQEQLAMQQLTRSIEQQSARTCLNASKQALTQSLQSNDHEGVADSIAAMVAATARWFAAGGR